MEFFRSPWWEHPNKKLALLIVLLLLVFLGMGNAIGRKQAMPQPSPSSLPTPTPVATFPVNGAPLQLKAFYPPTATPPPQLASLGPGISLTPSLVAQGCTHGTGVVKNPDSTYSFSWLHVGANGDILDSGNCVVHLLGINTGNTYWGNADHPNLQALTFYRQHINFNAIRLNYQAYWWDTDTNVPIHQTTFQPYLQQIISWAKSLGLYVILDTGPEYYAPPCGPGVPLCPSQNEGTKTNDPTQMIDYEPTAIQSLQELSKIYANDPAIIWDVWNEPANRPTNPATLIADYNERINTIKQNNPNALFMIYSRAFTVGGNFQGNIMEDFHDYSGNDLTAQITAAKAKGIATIVGEYGGSTGPGNFMNALACYAKNFNTNLMYYEDRNLFDSRVTPTSVNAIGQMLNSVYSGIFGLTASVSCGTPHQ